VPPEFVRPIVLAYCHRKGSSTCKQADISFIQPLSSAPTTEVGKGRGSRKLYAFDDLLRLAIAHELTEFGFNPSAVGAAVQVIRKSDLTAWSTALANAGETGEEPDEDEMRVLTCIGGKWEVLKAGEIRMQVTESLPFFALNFSALLVDVVKRISEVS